MKVSNTVDHRARNVVVGADVSLKYCFNYFLVVFILFLTVDLFSYPLLFLIYFPSWKMFRFIPSHVHGDIV